MYSAHDILDISITKKDDHLEASWWYKFTQRRRGEKAPLRFGKLVLFDDAASAVAGLSATVEGFGDELSSGLQAHSSGWLIRPRRDAREHDPLTPQVERSDDRRQGARGDLPTSSRGPERRGSSTLDVRVNFVATDAPYYPLLHLRESDVHRVRRAARAVPRGSFEERYAADVLPLARVGSRGEELFTMPLPTVNRDLRVYVGDDRAGRAKNPKFAAQSVFVRRLTHSERFLRGRLCSVVGQSSRMRWIWLC